MTMQLHNSNHDGQMPIVKYTIKYMDYKVNI